MLKKFDEIFNDLALDITEEIGSEVLIHNKEYREAGDKATKIFHKIKAVLPDEYKDLIHEFDNLTSYQQAIAEEIMYNQGLKDGIELKRLLKLVV